MANEYTPAWFSLFLSRPDPAATAAEAAFVLRTLGRLPGQTRKPPRVLDLCCGYGRHALLLAAGGCRVLGVDRDAAAVARAAEDADAAVRAGRLPKSRAPVFLQADMRRMDGIAGPFDAAVCLWHSFGYFSPAQNRAVLPSLSRLLRPGGALILDVYNREFMQAHIGTRRMEKDGRKLTEEVRREGRRFFVRLDYGPGGAAGDAFEWELYAPRELAALGAGCGLAAPHPAGTLTRACRLRPTRRGCSWCLKKETAQKRKIKRRKPNENSGGCRRLPGEGNHRRGGKAAGTARADVHRYQPRAARRLLLCHRRG